MQEIRRIATKLGQRQIQPALDGLGIAYVLEHEVAEFIRDGRLVRLLSDWTQPFAGFYLYYSSRQQMRPILAAFLRMLRERQYR
jgi:DNA-binding transcriptional LysR family regulator